MKNRMNNDLVTRLRSHDWHAVHDDDDDCAEAADEIERLRAVVRAADVLRGTGYEPRPAVAKVQAYDAAREVVDVIEKHLMRHLDG